MRGADIVYFELWGRKFRAINAGPLFRFNPSISFIVNFDPLFFGEGASAKSEAGKKLDEAWNKLSQGGKALMPLDKYPFSERYGWIEDKHGLTWQLMLTDPDGEPRPAIIPSLMFTGEKTGSQAEIDYYWEKLSSVPEAEQCGWLKNEFGVSWQVAPAGMDDMLREGNPKQVANLTQALMQMKKFDVEQMKKFDVEALKMAYEGAPRGEPAPFLTVHCQSAILIRWTPPEYRMIR